MNSNWIAAHKIPAGAWVSDFVDVIKTHFGGAFDACSGVFDDVTDAVTGALLFLPAPIMTMVLAVLVWWLRRSVGLAVFVALALLFIVNQGYWADTMTTLTLILFSTTIAMAVGVPVGIASAHRPWLQHALRPLLDLMQTLPTFVYLIPTLVLFGLGTAPGVLSTIVFSISAPIRMTQLGIASVPAPLVEAAESFGATPWQKLWTVELPGARTAIQAGLTQCIMLSLSMVVIAALVGAGGLGVPVVRALNMVQVNIGFEAGFAIVLVAIALDRICRPRAGPTGARGGGA